MSIRTSQSLAEGPVMDYSLDVHLTRNDFAALTGQQITDLMAAITTIARITEAVAVHRYERGEVSDVR